LVLINKSWLLHTISKILVHTCIQKKKLRMGGYIGERDLFTQALGLEPVEESLWEWLAESVKEVMIRIVFVMSE